MSWITALISCIKIKTCAESQLQFTCCIKALNIVSNLTGNMRFSKRAISCIVYSALGHVNVPPKLLALYLW